MTELEKEKLLLKISNKQDEMLERIEKLEENQNGMIYTQDGIIDIQNEMTKTQNEMTKTQNEMIKTQNEMIKTQNEMIKTQNEMQEEFQRLKNTVTVIEYEHGKKLDLILEVLTGHTDKLEQHEDRFDKDEKIIEMHGHQIYGLEKRLKA